MKKIYYFFTFFAMLAVIASCSKDNDEDLSVISKASVISAPVSDGGILPKIIDGANRGGNRTCAEVATAWGLPNGYFSDCGEKLDYGDFDGDGTNEFSGDFPDWLDVTVTDGKYVSFTVNNTGESCSKVGAVIVKGSAAANVYFYPGGTLSDGGLAAPLLQNGFPAGLSNLTFCCVTCQPIVLALKARYNYDETSIEPVSYVVSTGTLIFETDNWCKKLGINYYPNVSSFAVMDWYSNNLIGMANIVPLGSSLVVTVTFDEGIYPIQDLSYLYAGSLNGLTGGAEPPILCPGYPNWMKPSSVEDNVATFVVPF